MCAEPISPDLVESKPPGRWRRRLARLALWGFAALALLLVALWLVLESSWARETIRRKVVVAAGEALGREVEIATLDFALFPPSADLSGLAVGGPDGLGDPLATVDRLAVTAGPGLLRSLLGNAPVVLSEIVVDRPWVSLEFYEDGSSNLPDLPGDEESAEGGLEVRIGRLDLTDGELRLAEQSLPLAFSAEQFSASLQERVGGSMRVRADSPRLHAELLEGAVEGTLSLQAEVVDGGVELDHARLRAEALSADVDGGYRDETLRLEATMTADTALLETLGLIDEVRGSIDVEATLESSGEGWSVDARASAAELTLPEVEVLGLEIDAELEGSSGQWSIAARATSPELNVADLVVRRIEVGVGGSQEGVRAELEHADMATGSVSGVVDLPLSETGEIGVDLSVDGVDLVELLAAIEAPVAGLEGAMSGRAEYRFRADAPLLGHGTATVHLTSPVDDGSGDVDASSAPAVARPLALEGTIPVVVADGVLRVEGALLTAPGQRISASGELTLEEVSADFHFGLETEDPRAVLRVLPAIYENDDSPLWEPSRGRGVLDGTFSANEDGFRTGLELEILSSVVTGSAVPRIAGSIAIDSAGIQDLNLELSRHESSVTVRGSVPFDGVPESFTAPEFRLAVELDRWNVGDAEPWLDLELPFDGLGSGRLEIWGEAESPEGRLDLSVSQMSVQGIEIPGDLSGEIRFDPATIDLGPLRLRAPSGDVELAGTVDLEAERLDLRLISSPVDLAAPPFDDWIAGYVAGAAEISATLAGTFSSPELAARLTGSGLAVEEHPLADDGSSRLDLSWREGRVEVDGSLFGLAEVGGGGRFDDEVADLEISLATEELATILQLVAEEAPEDLDGRLGGVLEVRGPAAAPAVEVRIDEVELSHLDSRLANVEPVVLSLGADGARLESLYLAEAGTGSEIFVTGDLGSADREMDLRVVSSIDASWLGLYIPDLDIIGQLDLLAAIRGTFEQPEVDGQAELSDGRMIVSGFPHAIEEMHGFAFFYPDRVVIDSAEALCGGGVITAEGDLRADEQAEWSYELRFRAADLDLRYPPDWRIRGDALLTLSSRPDGRLLSGLVELERASYVRQNRAGFTQLLRTMLQRRPEMVEELDEVLVETRLNIGVTGPDALHIQTNVADLRGDLDFSVRGTLAAPVILGDIVLTRGGQIDLGGTEYRIERGVLTFANPFRNDPQIDLVAATQVKNYDVRLNVFGPFEDLETSMSSTPPLSNLDIVSLLTTGTVDMLGDFGSGSFTGESSGSAERFLAGQAASLAGQRVGTMLGLDQVQITPLTGGSADLSAARVTVGRRISRDIFVTYSHDPSESEEGIFELEWQLLPSIALILTRSDDGSAAFDLRWDTTF